MEGLALKKMPVTVSFASAVRDVVDERAGKKLGDGQSFKFEYDPVQAVMFSALTP